MLLLTMQRLLAARLWLSSFLGLLWLSACAAEPPAFPAGFLFGTAIAPYQTEGGLTATDWAQWETACPACSRQRADDGSETGSIDLGAPIASAPAPRLFRKSAV